MTHEALEDLNIEAFETMPSPDEVHVEFPASASALRTVYQGRRTLEAILDRKDPRVFLVVGPCSIHDPRAGMEYARRLAKLAEEVADTLVLVMRVYFEKPRTSTGWKGFINDPRLDGSFHVEEGIRRARAFLLEVAELGLPAGTEALDPLTPLYLGDLVTWTAIGARTAESQTHREMSSGLSTPVGFKNGTDGDLQVAVNGILSASTPHSFLGINGQGAASVLRTRGNRYGHLVLRGGGGRPNFDTASVSIAEQALGKAGLPLNIVVDCSHANSFRNPNLQPLVMADCIHQILRGDRSIVGLMAESFIEEGSQAMTEDPGELRFGCSITDPCLDWDRTERMIRDAREQLKGIVTSRSSDFVCASGPEPGASMFLPVGREPIGVLGHLPGGTVADSPSHTLRSLSELSLGQEAMVYKVQATGTIRRRLLEMGFVRGERVMVKKLAPLGDPMELVIKGYHLSLRREESSCILVTVEA